MNFGLARTPIKIARYKLATEIAKHLERLIQASRTQRNDFSNLTT